MLGYTTRRTALPPLELAPRDEQQVAQARYQIAAVLEADVEVRHAEARTAKAIADPLFPPVTVDACQAAENAPRRRFDAATRELGWYLCAGLELRLDRFVHDLGGGHTYEALIRLGARPSPSSDLELRYYGAHGQGYRVVIHREPPACSLHPSRRRGATPTPPLVCVSCGWVWRPGRTRTATLCNRCGKQGKRPPRRALVRTPVFDDAGMLVDWRGLERVECACGRTIAVVRDQSRRGRPRLSCRNCSEPLRTYEYVSATDRPLHHVRFRRPCGDEVVLTAVGAVIRTTDAEDALTVLDCMPGITRMTR